MGVKNRFGRRKFLRTTAVAAACGSLASCSESRRPSRFFTDEEARTVDAICERIVPQDADAGASAAGVVDFIDCQLMGPHRSYRELYRQGLLAIDESSLARFSKRFAGLDPDRQDEILALVEKAEAPGDGWKKVSPQEFFKLIVDHAFQGFYGDPRHGGNRNGVTWKMLGLPYPPVRGRDQYRFG